MMFIKSCAIWNVNANASKGMLNEQEVGQPALHKSKKKGISEDIGSLKQQPKK